MCHPLGMKNKNMRDLERHWAEQAKKAEKSAKVAEKKPAQDKKDK
jgi:hypothetical protein